MKAAVYAIRNKEEEKFYIGSCVNYKKRKRNHISALKRNDHRNKELQKIYNEKGIDVLEFIKLVELQEKELDELRDLEKFYLETFKDYTYNSEDISTYSPISFILSDEAKKKISKNKVGSLNANAKLNEAKVKEIKKLLKKNISVKEIANMFNISCQIIYNIKNNKVWKHVS